MMPPLPTLLVIAGPTASGKSAAAMTIARAIPAEIVSADSRQIYRRLTIGTAKPSSDDMQEVPHHCIDIRDPDQTYNAGMFQEEGRRAIDDIIRRGKLPILVGGTGLYLRAAIDGFFDLPELSGSVRPVLEERLRTEGRQALYDALLAVDPESAQSMDPSKFRRVIRALEVYHETGVPISYFHKHHRIEPRYDARFFGLEWDRTALYDRINSRVDRMMEEGFVEEVRSLFKDGCDDRLQSLQTVGYAEAFAFLRGEISRDRMVDLMKQNTRRFAKRQMTWFRKEPRITWLPVHNDEDIVTASVTIMKSIQQRF